MTAPYAFPRPTLTDAERAVHRLYPNTGAQVWSALLARTPLTGTETDDQALLDLITTMTRSDEVLSLYAQALRIRVDTHTALTAAHALVRGAE
ncbi:hypothetical protein JOD54_006149 [Actinokineospora baliensis]|uniref:hypothetical protein n=1 Tax=Actinokineospora baliensis TaxID=547056 RepID=UPI00195EAA18|nr:hypothetical protein [Actinokineospora baliensis]MBM7775945.1 hypothetical protein [Actinokineospora baliensis]